MNSVILMGRLTRDPELSYNKTTGNAMSRFTVAVDRRMSRQRKQEMEANGQPTADFINVVCWGKIAESVNSFVGKGNRVLVEGRIQTGSYTAQDGSRRYTTDVVANQVEFLDWKSQGASQGFSGSNYGNDRPDGGRNSAGSDFPQNTRTGKEEEGDDSFLGDDFNPVDDSRIPF